MCLSTEGQSRLFHECTLECPICWIFLYPANQESLVSGEKLPLGTASDLMRASENGCQLSSLWLQLILESEYGPNYPLESYISASVDPSFRSLPADIRSIKLCINDWKGVKMPLGDGLVEIVHHGYEQEFGLWAPHGSPVAELIKQRPAEPGVNYPDAYITAREWISECLESHEKCPKQSSPSNLPTRVLDLAADSRMERIKLKISGGAKAQYAALSYCWGSTKQMTTTIESLLSFSRDGIEIKELPKTLQDAIQVCRNLELRYLWIDSLCILQDSAVDKAVEISMMPQIYKGATVTISAAVASDCGQGFLEDRSQVRDVLAASFPLPYALRETGKTDLPEVLSSLDEDDADMIFLCPSRYCGFNVKEFEKEPINQRAWTLQESWLSPRLLIYGAGPLQWQCLSTAKSFGGTPPSQVQEDFFPTRNRHKFIAPGSDFADRETLSSEWMKIVSEYTRRSMTDPQDKLPALSGIAAEFGRLSGDEYVAGLWVSTLPYGLLWYQVSQPLSSPNEPYRAPSWSWAAVDGVIGFARPFPYIARTEVTINSVSITPATPLAPLANVVAGELILTGPVRSMTWQEVQERFVIVDVGQSAHMYWDYIIPDNGLGNPYFKNPARNEQYAKPGQNVKVSTFPPSRNALIPMTLRVDAVNSGIHESSGRKESEDGQYVFLEITRATEPIGLVLTVAGGGTFKRIGYFYLGRRDLLEEEERDGFWTPGEREWDWNENLELRTVTIV